MNKLETLISTLSEMESRINLEVILWKEIYDRVKKRGKLVNATLGNHSFQYTLANSDDGYDKDTSGSTGKPYIITGYEVTSKVKLVENMVGMNFNGISFIFEKQTPPEFRPFVGLHEHIEILNSHMPNDVKHGYACLADITEALKMSDEFIEKYARWTVEGDLLRGGRYFSSIPEVAQQLKQDEIEPVTLLKQYYHKLSQREHIYAFEEKNKITVPESWHHPHGL